MNRPKTPGAMVLDQAKNAITTCLGFEFKDGELQTVNANDLFAVYLAGRGSEQTPAVGGEPEVVSYHDDGVSGIKHHPLIKLADHRANVATLLARIEEYEVNTLALETEASEKDYSVKILRERISELEAQIAKLRGEA